MPEAKTPNVASQQLAKYGYSSSGTRKDPFWYQNKFLLVLEKIPSLNFIIFNFWLFSAIGGYNGQNLNSVERFDQRVGNWEYIAPMSNHKRGAGATVLDGKIFVAGGYNRSYLNTIEMFESITLLVFLLYLINYPF